MALGHTIGSALAALVVVAALAACGTAEAQPAPRPPPGTVQVPEHRPPVGAVAPRCTVRAEIVPTLLNRGKAVRLRFVLVNLDARATTVGLRGTCPAGLVELRGLPAGYDPMHTCQAGACVEPELVRTFEIAGKRAQVVIGQTVLQAAGDRCNPALPMGSTLLSAGIRPDDPMEVCGGAQVHLRRDARTGRLSLAKLSDPRLPAPPVVVTAPPAPAPAKPAPAPAKPAPRSPTKLCPTCGFACLHGTPRRGTDANGCPICGCDDDGLTR